MEKTVKNSTIPDTFNLLFPEVNDMLREGIRRSCGSEFVDVLEESRGDSKTSNNWLSNSSLKVGEHWKKSGDFKCSCATAIFCRYTGTTFKKKRRRKKHQATKFVLKKSDPKKAMAVQTENQNDVMKVTTLSEYGLPEIRIYTSPRQVAEEIVACLPEDQVASLISGIQIAESGCITFTTKQHLHWHLIMGRLPCSECGQFLRGSRGLRMHQMSEHGQVYEVAQKEAKDTEMQIILYKETPVLSSKWKKDAEKIHEIRINVGDPGIEAARNGDLDKLRTLIANNWNPHNTVDKHGSTAFMWASGEGHLSVCQFLSDECNINVNELKGQPKKRRHALHWAARNGHIPICEWLIMDKGVDANVSTDDGTVPLHFAVWTGSKETVFWFVEVAHCDISRRNSYGCNASQWCALNGDLKILKYLHGKGLDVQVLNRNGHSALHKAATKGQSDICFWLIKSEDEGGGGLGISHMQADRDGCTPAKLAWDNNFPSLGGWLSQQMDMLMPKSEEMDYLSGAVNQINIQANQDRDDSKESIQTEDLNDLD